MKPTKIQPETLFVRRLSGRAVELVLEGLDLQQVGIKWNWDDPRQLLLWPDGFYRLASDWDARNVGEGVAAVFLDVEQKNARVVIKRIEALLMPSHRKEFEPRAVGIVRDGRPNDVDVTVSLEEVLGSEEGSLLVAVPQRGSMLAPRARQVARGKPHVNRCRSKVGRGE